MGDVVMPGDSLKEIKKEGKNERENVILGPGLRREGDKIYICKAGILKRRDPAVYYVDSYQKRYRAFYILCMFPRLLSLLSFLFCMNLQRPITF